MTWWLRDPVEFPWMDWISEPESDQVTELVGELYKPHRPPAVGGVDPNAFCAVTLSVNQSRVVVRDWLEVPVDQVQRKLGQWFADHQVTDLWKDGQQPVPFWLLANATGRWGTEGNQERYLA